MTTELPAPEPTADDIGHQMEGTRAHMAAQMHALEHRVTGMAAEAASAAGDAAQEVRDTVRAIGESIQGAAHDTAAAVRHALDLRGHARRHPWAVMVGAVALGFVCGRWSRP